MIVGFMRNYRKPTKMAELTTKICNYDGIELIYLRPRDVNMDKGSVKGKMFIDGKWMTVITELPTVIDVSPYCFKAKNKKIMNYLRKNTYLTDKRKNVLNKEQLQERLQADEKFAHLVIPTIKVNGFKEIEEFIHQYSKIVLKPVRGERGKGVYILENKGNSFLLGFYKEEKELTYNDLVKFYEDEIKSKSYLAQKYISSRSIQGDPFDCRVHIEKNGEGKWEIGRKFIRVGIGQKVMSNISQGGGISDPEAFLKANFGDKSEEILEKLDKVAYTLPYKFEELRKHELMSLGIDVGIDKNGELYVFEINTAPITSPLLAEAVTLRTQYYKYLLQNKLKN